METLADFLNAQDPFDERPARSDNGRGDEQSFAVSDALDVRDPVAFCQAVIASREFRQYILNGIILGILPPAVMCRIIDHAWGKPIERVEHSGKDGGPVVTEVRRVIIRAPMFGECDDDGPPDVTH